MSIYAAYVPKMQPKRNIYEILKAKFCRPSTDAGIHSKFVPKMRKLGWPQSDTLDVIMVYAEFN